MNNHIVIVNAPKFDPDLYFQRLISQIRLNAAMTKTPIVLLNNVYFDGLPMSLEHMGVNFVLGHGNHEADFKKANLEDAAHIVVLADDEHSDDSDSLSFDICHRMKEHGLAYRVIAECVDDENRERFKRIGVKTIIRPIRSYPEILVRAIESPGAEIVIEDMFTRSDDLIVRFPLWLEGDKWQEVMMSMIIENLGTPLAYISKEGHVCVHPSNEESVYAQSILMLVRTESAPTETQVHDAFSTYHKKQLSA
jgi:voltage-gated potassium channel